MRRTPKQKNLDKLLQNTNKTLSKNAKRLEISFSHALSFFRPESHSPPICLYTRLRVSLLIAGSLTHCVSFRNEEESSARLLRIGSVICTRTAICSTRTYCLSNTLFATKLQNSASTERPTFEVRCADWSSTERRATVCFRATFGH